MSVPIRGQQWTFKTTKERQICNNNESNCVIHDDKSLVLVNGNLPHERQLELAAQAAQEIIRGSMTASELEQALCSYVPFVGTVDARG